MNGIVDRPVKSGRTILAALVVGLVVFQAAGRTQGSLQGPTQGSFMYNSGQSVAPMYHGWEQLPDGSKNLHFGYLNRNWEEEFEIPIGPDNNISPAPYGPDGGQPTYFLPRHNRWQFKVHVPADFGKGGEELVWTLTTKGQTVKAYATMHPNYVQDHHSIQREVYDTPPEGNTDPVVKLETARQLTAKVGEPVTLVAIATDDGLPRPVVQARGDDDGDADAGTAPRRQRIAITGPVGTATGRTQAKGLRFAWYLYRGPGGVKFDPPQFEVWEDTRAGRDSPFSPGWTTPPIPPGNRWAAQATFTKPGTYVIRAWADDSYLKAYQDVTVTVTP